MKLNIIVESRTPKVGIFWYIDGELVDFTDDARDIPVVSGFRDGPRDHYSTWPDVRKAYKVRGDGFDYPRGRVLYRQDKERFEIITSSELANDRKSMMQVMRRFSLPSGKTVAVADDHYEVDPDLEADLG